MKKTIVALGVFIIAGFTPLARAGCIGPEIMGKCEGAEVPWDTHPDGRIRQDAPPGFYYDKRGTRDDQQYPGSVNPFTGRDANDSRWGDVGIGRNKGLDGGVRQHWGQW